jgi:WD40 repeat protein
MNIARAQFLKTGASKWSMKISALLLLAILAGIVSAQTPNDHMISAISWNVADPSLIAVGYDDGVIEIIDATTNTIQNLLQFDPRPILALRWSHDGNFLASSSYSGQTTIGIWDMNSYQPSSLLIELEDRPVLSLEFNTSSNELLTVDTDHGLRIWDVTNGSLLGNPLAPGLSMVAINLQSSQLVTAAVSPIFVRWDLSAGYHGVEFSQLADNGISALDQEILALTWNQAGTRVATGQRNGILRIWDTSTSPIFAVSELHTNDERVVDYDISAVRDVTFLNNDAEVATISADGQVRSWDVATEQLLLNYNLGQSITAAEFSPDGALIAYGTTSGSKLSISSILRRPLLADSNIVPEQSGHEYQISAISWNVSDPSLIAVGYDDGVIEIIDATTNTIQNLLQFDLRPIRALRWSHDGALLASSSYSGQTTTIGIWNMNAPQSNPLLIELENWPVSSLEFNTSNDELLTVDTYHGLRIWDVTSGSLLGNPPPSGLQKLAINLQSNELITAAGSPIFVRWDLSAGYRGVEFSQLADNGIPVLDQVITALTWNQAGTRVATGQLNGLLRNWDTSTSPIVTVSVLQANDETEIHYTVSAVSDVTFLNNDAQVATISADGQVRSWNVVTEQRLLDYNLGQSIIAAEFSPDGALIAYGTTSGSGLSISATSNMGE